MSFKPALVSALIFLAATCVFATIPEPHDQSGPRSVCGTWRASFGPTQSMKGGVAKVLTTKDTPALNSVVKRSTLERRISTGIPSQTLRPGLGACGTVYTDSDMVVCLWNGVDSGQSRNGLTPGWLTSLTPSNCGHKVYVQYGGKTVYGYIADGCPIGAPGERTDYRDGCNNLFLSSAMMKALTNSDDVTSITVSSWDFVNLSEAY